MQIAPQDVDLLQAKLQHVVDSAVHAAATRIMFAVGDRQMVTKNWCVPQRVQNAIDKSIRQHLHNGLRLMLTSPDALLPYQETLSAAIKSDIEAGNMHLIAYCNSTVNSQTVPWDYITSGILKECNVPACTRMCIVPVGC